MNNAKIKKTLERFLDGNGRFNLGLCSVVGYTPATKIDYDFKATISLYECLEDEAWMLMLEGDNASLGLNIHGISSNTEVAIDGNIIHIESKICSLVIEREEE